MNKTDWLITLRNGDMVMISNLVRDNIHKHIASGDPEKLLAVSPNKSINVVEITGEYGDDEIDKFLRLKGQHRCKYGAIHKLGTQCDCQMVARLTDIKGLFGDGEEVTPKELESREKVHAQFTDEQRRENIQKLRELKNSIRRKFGWPERNYNA